MEADKFDKLFAGKLKQADVPGYKESGWQALKDNIPVVGAGVSLTNWSLISLLVLSNSWWAWSSFKSIESPVSTTGPMTAVQAQIYESRVVTLYDTVVETVTIKKTLQEDFENESVPKVYDETADIVTPHNQEENMIIPGNVLVLVAENETNDGTFNADKTNSVDEDGTNVDSAAVDEHRHDRPEVPKPEKAKKIRQPYQGSRWFIGLDLHKPLSPSGNQMSQFNGSGIGLNVEFALSEWISLTTEISRWSQGYFIRDNSFYHDGEPNGVYGPTYSWRDAAVESRYTQGGLSFTLSPFMGSERFRPFGTVGYLLNFNTDHDVTNRLEEEGTGKIIRVETDFPDGNASNQYLRSELGVTGAINANIRLRMSAAYWKQLAGNPYEKDLIGIKAGFIYRIR